MMKKIYLVLFLLLWLALGLTVTAINNLGSGNAHTPAAGQVSPAQH